jgi:hypothetical protein
MRQPQGASSGSLGKKRAPSENAALAAKAKISRRKSLRKQQQLLKG